MRRHESIALAIAGGRVLFGTALMIDPARAAGLWVGHHAHDERSKALARGLGVRDAALGAGVLLSLSRGDTGESSRWIAFSALSDSVDMVATVAAGDALDPRMRVRAAAGAGAAAALGWAAAVAAGRRN